MAKTKEQDVLSELREELKTTVSDLSDNFEVLKAAIQTTRSRQDCRLMLARIAPVAKELPDTEREQLREEAANWLSSLQNRIASERLNGQHVRIDRARYTDTKFGGTYMLFGAFVGGDLKDVKWECWLPGSEGGQTYRFFARLRRDQYPLEVIFTKTPHEFRDKATGQMKQGSIWNVERIPDQQGLEFEEVPF